MFAQFVLQKNGRKVADSLDVILSMCSFSFCLFTDCGITIYYFCFYQHLPATTRVKIKFSKVRTTQSQIFWSERLRTFETFIRIQNMFRVWIVIPLLHHTGYPTLNENMCYTQFHRLRSGSSARRSNFAFKEFPA